MPFVRFTRDKRGYEYVYLVEASTRHRQAPPRVLYWYRTPPGVRVGREPFDAEVRRTLEDRYRDITFDWKAITSARAPNPETESWRERRRAKRDARRPPAAAQSSPAAAPDRPAELDQAEAAEQEDLDAIAPAAEPADESGFALAADAEPTRDDDAEVDGDDSEGHDGDGADDDSSE